MKIRKATIYDIPAWLSLSREYDEYVKELVSNLTEWYEGSETSISFNDYMESKISKDEAFIATGEEDQDCFGIIAISTKNNRITFFGVSHNCDFMKVGERLLSHALSLLNTNANISANIIKSEAAQIQNEYKLFTAFGFTYLSDGLENGVPVNVMILEPEMKF